MGYNLKYFWKMYHIRNLYVAMSLFRCFVLFYKPTLLPIHMFMPPISLALDLWYTANIFAPVFAQMSLKHDFIFPNCILLMICLDLNVRPDWILAIPKINVNVRFIGPSPVATKFCIQVNLQNYSRVDTTQRVFHLYLVMLRFRYIAWMLVEYIN